VSALTQSQTLRLSYNIIYFTLAPSLHSALERSHAEFTANIPFTALSQSWAISLCYVHLAGPHRRSAEQTARHLTIDSRKPYLLCCAVSCQVIGKSCLLKGSRQQVATWGVK